MSVGLRPKNRRVLTALILVSPNLAQAVANRLSNVRVKLKARRVFHYCPRRLPMLSVKLRIEAERCQG